MLDHATIRVRDRAGSERFYDTVLATLGPPGQERHGADTIDDLRALLAKRP